MTSDRNLLYGMLALQLDFVTRDQLIDTMQLWVVNKTISIGDLFVKHGHLEPPQRELLDGLLVAHLQKHQGDVRQSLAALTMGIPVREELEKVQDEELAQSVQLLPAGSPPARYETIAPTEAHESRSVIRYEVMRPLSQGGLGKVSVARDLELHREVAFKEILPAQADREDRRCQFTLEAEVTGGLEHPGIVPVYGLGCSADGRPYYAMRLIHGDSMREVLTKYHRELGGVVRQSFPLHKLLARFVAVCEAVHYAHSRGVLHRDLKPDNIMLGEFGETIVVDWGLAKIDPQAALSLAGDATRERLSPPSASLAIPEPRGAVVGTVDYMAPEQAIGDTDHIGIHTDVYGLGAILYHTLTGQAPAKAPSLHERLRIAERGDIPAPRSLALHIPKALEAICMKALAVRPANRYPTARALSEDIQLWLADEPVTAYIENRRERTARWMRRNWPRVQALIGSLVAIMVMLFVASSLIYGAKQRESRAKQQEIEARQRAEESKRVALVNFRRARDAVDTWLSGPANDLQGYPGVDEFRLRLLSRAAEDYATFASETSDDPEILFENGRTQLRLGQLLTELHPPDQQADSKAAFQQGRSILEKLLATDSSNVDYAIELANCYNEQGRILMKSEELPASRNLFQQAIDLVASFLPADGGEGNSAAFPNAVVDPAPISLGPAEVVNSSKDTSENSNSVLTKARLQAALARYVFNRALSLEDSDNVGAERDYRRALSLFAQAMLVAPDQYQAEYARTLQYLSAVMRKAKQLKEAETLIRDAIASLEQAAMQTPGQASMVAAGAEAREYLADLLRSLGRGEEVRRIYDELIAIYSGLVKSNPQRQPYGQALGRVYFQLGLFHLQQGQLDAAELPLQNATQMFRDLVAVSPATPKYLELLATTLDTQAQLWLEQARVDEARVAAEEATGLLQGILDSLGPTRTNQHRLAVCFSHLGQIAQRLNEPTAANLHFQNALQYLDQLLQKQGDPSIQSDLALVWLHAAEAADSAANSAAMAELVRRANSAWRDVAQQTPAPEFRYTWLRHITIYAADTEVDDADWLSFAQALVDVAPQNAGYHAALGAVLYRQDEMQLARASFAEAARLRSAAPDAYTGLFQAMLEASVGDKIAALEIFQQAEQQRQAVAPGNQPLQRLSAEARLLIE